MALPRGGAPLTILGAEQDIPRLISGVKKVRGGTEVAVVIRPGESITVATFLTTGRGKKKATTAATHTVTFNADGHATVTEQPKLTAAAAKKVLRSAKAKPPAERPTTMRGKWVGKLYAEASGFKQITLYRRVASYGQVTLHYTRPLGWTVTLERKQKWFSGAKSKKLPNGYSDLSAAIAAAYAEILGLVQEACGLKDTRRRAAHDPDYAAKHPIKPARTNADRLAVFLGKAHPSAPQPAPPKTKAAQAQATEALAADAIETVTALAAASSAPTAIDAGKLVEQQESFRKIVSSWAGWRAQMSTLWGLSPQDVADHHRTVRGAQLDPQTLSGKSWDGIEEIGDLLYEYATGHHDPRDVTVPLSVFGDKLRAMLREQLDREIGLGFLKATAKQQEQIEGELEMALHLLKSAPALLARVATLIRYSAAAIASPRCQGAAQQDAQAAHDEAVRHYTAARVDLIEGNLSMASLRTLRQAARSVALSAAKAGRDCRAGQASLGLGAPIRHAPDPEIPAGVPTPQFTPTETNTVIFQTGAFTADSERSFEEMRATAREIVAERWPRAEVIATPVYGGGHLHTLKVTAPAAYAVIKRFLHEELAPRLRMYARGKAAVHPIRVWMEWGSGARRKSAAKYHQIIDETDRAIAAMRGARDNLSKTEARAFDADATGRVSKAEKTVWAWWPRDGITLNRGQLRDIGNAVSLHRQHGKGGKKMTASEKAAVVRLLRRGIVRVFRTVRPDQPGDLVLLGGYARAAKASKQILSSGVRYGVSGLTAFFHPDVELLSPDEFAAAVADDGVAGHTPAKKTPAKPAPAKGEDRLTFRTAELVLPTGTGMKKAGLVREVIVLAHELLPKGVSISKPKPRKRTFTFRLPATPRHPGRPRPGRREGDGGPGAVHRRLAGEGGDRGEEAPGEEDPGQGVRPARGGGRAERSRRGRLQRDVLRSDQGGAVGRGGLRWSPAPPPLPISCSTASSGTSAPACR